VAVWCGLLERNAALGVPVPTTELGGTVMPEVNYEQVLAEGASDVSIWSAWLDDVQSAIIAIAPLWLDRSSWLPVDPGSLPFAAPGSSIPERLDGLRDALLELVWQQTTVLTVPSHSFTASHLWPEGFIYATHALPSYWGPDESAIVGYRLESWNSMFGVVALEPDDSDPAYYPNQQMVVRRSDSEFPDSIPENQWSYRSAEGGLDLFDAGVDTAPAPVTFNLEDFPNEQGGVPTKNSDYRYFLTGSGGANWEGTQSVQFILNGHYLAWFSGSVLDVTDQIKSGDNVIVMTLLSPSISDSWDALEIREVVLVTSSSPASSIIVNCRPFALTPEKWGTRICPVETWNAVVSGLYSPLSHICIPVPQLLDASQSRNQDSKVAASPAFLIANSPLLLSWPRPRNTSTWEVALSAPITQNRSGNYVMQIGVVTIPASQIPEHGYPVDIVLNNGEEGNVDGAIDLVRGYCRDSGSQNVPGSSIDYCTLEGCNTEMCELLDIQVPETTTDALVAWLDASCLGAVYDDGDSILLLEDRSGRSRNAISQSLVEAPILREPPGGISSLLFGSDVYTQPPEHTGRDLEVEWELTGSYSESDPVIPYYILHFGSSGYVNEDSGTAVIVDGTTETDGFVVIYRRSAGTAYATGEQWAGSTNHSSSMQITVTSMLTFSIYDYVLGSYTLVSTENVTMSALNGVKFGRMSRTNPFKIEVRADASPGVIRMVWYSTGTPEYGGVADGTGTLPYSDTVAGAIFGAFALTSDVIHYLAAGQLAYTGGGTGMRNTRVREDGVLVQTVPVDMTGVTGITWTEGASVWHTGEGSGDGILVQLYDITDVFSQTVSSSLISAIQGTVPLATPFTFPTGQQLASYSAGTFPTAASMSIGIY
jgi:hypothetical protein